MTLVLEIEYLLGVAFAAREKDNPVPDWPPQPDRVFSALVSAWGARGERADERSALEWLEELPAPELASSDGCRRTAPTVFVPPNDLEISQNALNSAWFQYLRRGERPPKTGGHEKQWKDALGVVPSYRTRSARIFPAYRPDDPTISLIWREAAPDRGTFTALNALAADTACVGHPASLARCRFRLGDAPTGALPAWRPVYRGRLTELEADFHARPLRRPGPGDLVRITADKVEQARSGVFSDHWLVLEHVEDTERGGEMPDIRAVALVAKALRDALMSGYRKIGLGEVIPVAVSGHAPDGRPSREPHLAIAPLAFLGMPHASGTVFGFALIPPRGGDLFTDSSFRHAVRAIMPPTATDDGAETRRRLVLGGLRLAFEIGEGSGRRSLDPSLYCGMARVWATGTPIVLDRHLKASGNKARQQETEGLIRQACTNIGLPEPKCISAGKHSALEGAPSAYPSGGAPGWMRWRLPPSLASRQLTHAMIEFPGPVCGPVMLGAGRFVGLGLCRPLDPERQR